VTVDDKWHIGSNTKVMTATFAGIFVERGLVTWDTTIEEVFPELQGEIHSEFLDVRLEELLSHTAGISNNLAETPFWATAWENDAPIAEQRESWLPQLLSLEPDASRGTFSYSNSGYVVAGAMLERLTGESWENLMRQELFRPLGMKGAQGKSGVVRAETFEKLHAPFPETTYALGWGVVEGEWARGNALTHNGSNTLWYHTVWVAPERDIAIVVATYVTGEHTAMLVDIAVGAILRRFEASEVQP
jgi:CubicO group peptidase (beta-lactamase class C family)